MNCKSCGLHSLATVVSARELHRPSGVGAERSITSQWQVHTYPKFLFLMMNMHYEKLGRRLKLIVPKYHPDPVSCLEDIPEKVYST